MVLSVFEIFKIGIGPSSSHTMGPMTAAARFLDMLRHRDDDLRPSSLTVSLHGSLAFTGKGHATDRAIALGLLGCIPAKLDPDAAEQSLAELRETKTLRHADLPDLQFDPEENIQFDFGPALPGHANGMVFQARDESGETIFERTFYSVGGGFIVTAEELDAPVDPAKQPAEYPYPFATAAKMLAMARASGKTIAQMMRANETASQSTEILDQGLADLWAVMDGCIDRGLSLEGELPGGLRVKRRAKKIHEQLLKERGNNQPQPHVVADWLNVYAMAVNEENAAGGKVVTAPTNGAAGVVPAVIRYYLDHCVGADRSKVSDFLLTAAAIGGLIKQNASISGAEAGCQGEVGSASSMAAAGLCAVLGGSAAQVENAAEIALEHHLGMTCDPVGGLVQVPCIERNGMGATKAVAAASLALRGDGSHFMPFDNCIRAMREIGEEMSTKFKETSQGGLAVNLPEC
ncbi:MAG: L-serine ammonia-lyase [Pseudomonadota bacterium]